MVLISRPTAAWGLAALWAAALPAAGGSVSGSVESRIETRARAPRPDVTALGRTVAPGVPDRSRSVVYFETAPQPAFEQAPRPRAHMDQIHETFVPYVLAVTVGTVVDFPNDDATYHNVFSLSKAKRFDLGRYARGHSKSVLFDQPGIVRVFCDIHSHMSAFVLVFAHRYFATTDAQGRYRIGDVPPGAYSLAVWTDGAVRAHRAVSVTAAAPDARADFVVE